MRKRSKWRKIYTSSYSTHLTRSRWWRRGDMWEMKMKAFQARGCWTLRLSSGAMFGRNWMLRNSWQWSSSRMRTSFKMKLLDISTMGLYSSKRNARKWDRPLTWAPIWLSSSVMRWRRPMASCLTKMPPSKMLSSNIASRRSSVLIYSSFALSLVY